MSLRSMKMSKAALLAAAATGVMVLASTSHAFTFPTLAGPYVVNTTSQSLILNDILNSAGVPANNYVSATVTATWALGSGDPWSSEAQLGFNGGTKFGASSGAANNDLTTLLTWTNFPLGLGYNPSVSAPLTIDLRQTYGGNGSTGLWSNVTVTLNVFVPPTPPAGAIDLGTLAPGGMLMAQNAYVANTVQWYKFNVGTAIPATEQFRAFTAGNTLTGGFGPGDTEMALFDVTGNPILANDDFDFGNDQLWSNIAQNGLAAGDYWIAVSAFNLTVGSNFSATAADSGTPTGDIKLTILPAPGSAALLGLGGLLATRRRRV